jgi:ABC-type lipoprotein release transport system permease subunit
MSPKLVRKLEYIGLALGLIGTISGTILAIYNGTDWTWPFASLTWVISSCITTRKLHKYEDADGVTL